MARGHASFENYLFQLKDCEILRKMDAKSATSFFSLFHEETWPKRSCILNHEKLFYHFYIILSGRIKMYQIEPGNGKEITLFLLTKNDIFDIFCLLDGTRHRAYYECLDNAKVLAAPMDTLRKWLKNNPEHYHQILAYVGTQLRMLEGFVVDIAFCDIYTRLLQLILKNVNKESKNLELINDLSNKEIANLIGATRAVLNRHLQKLKQLGSINMSRKKLEVKNLEILINLLEEKKKPGI